MRLELGLSGGLSCLVLAWIGAGSKAAHEFGEYGLLTGG